MSIRTADLVYDIYDRREDMVALEVIIGHGQFGSSHIKLDSNILGDFVNSFTLEIGPGKTLKRKILTVLTTIHNLQSNTDDVNLTIELTGGKKLMTDTIIDDITLASGAIETAVISVLFI